MFPNLRAEMARLCLDGNNLAKALGVSYKTVINKMIGKTEFTRIEMFTIRKTFFPNLSIDYLFEEAKESGISQ